jgi:hypothetical protein
MTGRKSSKVVKKRVAQQPQQAANQQQGTQQDDLGSPPANIKREQPPPAQTVKKILKAENDEARTLKIVFKSNPDSQMKDFIKKAVVAKPPQQATKVIAKTPADTHPPAVAQELLETDDDVADNLAKLFKASKSYKNI